MGWQPPPTLPAHGGSTRRSSPNDFLGSPTRGEVKKEQRRFAAILFHTLCLLLTSYNWPKWNNPDTTAGPGRRP